MNSKPTKSGFPKGYDPFQEPGQLSTPTPVAVKLLPLLIDKTTQIRAAAALLLVFSIDLCVLMAKLKHPMLLMIPLILTATSLFVWVKAPDAPPTKRTLAHADLAFYVIFSLAVIAACGYTLSVSELTVHGKRGNVYVLKGFTLWITTIALACAAINMLTKVYDNLTQHRLGHICIYVSAIAQWVGWTAMSLVFACLRAPMR